ncbi:uncharacterized protein F5891DRAFT_1044825 [Suillus fuscotomentosus]|uniref:Secreted protein n=1 Tax=Suillus fuscotomentosus TaxID=1912939 RepID=A0AAD4E2K1_9AGAM|nr:uncharacterized protein F5891DRAFT_1044825 [Suillus fuscotomentosus]KAG1898172.1 hypothetical protein F5891DRAFT_1044825 [Suillus fuscotomentosus]
MHLISWLDWSVWVKCRLACGFEEMCYLPTWPFGFFWTPGTPLQGQWDSGSLWPDPNKGEWKRPQTPCANAQVRRMRERRWMR